MEITYHIQRYPLRYKPSKIGNNIVSDTVDLYSKPSYDINIGFKVLNIGFHPSLDLSSIYYAHNFYTKIPGSTIVWFSLHDPVWKAVYLLHLNYLC